MAILCHRERPSSCCRRFLVVDGAGVRCHHQLNFTAHESHPLSTNLPVVPTATASTGSEWGQSIPYDRFLDCVHCGLCTSACPTYLETGDENDSPRGRIYLMRAVTDGRVPLTDKISGHLDLCLDCRSCESACPSGVQYGRLIEPFRVEMRRGSSGATATASKTWFERFILHGLFPYSGRLQWALWPARIVQSVGLDRLAEATGLTRLLPGPLRRMQRLLPKMPAALPPLPLRLPARGKRRATVALFTGCVADAMFRHVHWATAKVLQANGCDVLVPRMQTCCGAIHYHSGSGGPALDMARQNVAAFTSDEVDAVVVNVAGCGSMLKDYGHMAEEVATGDATTQQQLSEFASKIRDVNEFLDALVPIAPTREIRVQAAYHDACHLCHAQQIRVQPRRLLQSIPGLTLVPLAESEICCGAAGSYNLTEPEMSDRLGRRKLDNILASGAEVVVS
ncbi:MAG: 4Fe-4S dicluster domain-containing protein, partial [Planctomycetaceae bacterium]|nr:4Fe-4S dicluster domain-containing protein [Planctomycetaceae bacterium]